MKTIMPTLSIALILAFPSLAAAQSLTGRGPQAIAGDPEQRLAPGLGLASGGPRLPTAPIGEDAPGARSRPPRSEKAIGPDLTAYIFAPIEVIVTPINDGVHGFDALIAPINDVLQPIVGPLNLGSPQPAETVIVPPPPRIGPRK